MLSSLRQTLRRWLHENEVDTHEAHDVLVACGEACNNAIEHGSAHRDAWFEIEASMLRDDASRRDEVLVKVRNAGGWRSPRDDGGGRGFPVMRALMDAVEVERSASGTEVRMRRKLNCVPVS